MVRHIVILHLNKKLRIRGGKLNKWGPHSPMLDMPYKWGKGSPLKFEILTVPATSALAGSFPYEGDPRLTHTNGLGGAS
jgi:hypothetical protein